MSLLRRTAALLSLVVVASGVIGPVAPATAASDDAMSAEVNLGQGGAIAWARVTAEAELGRIEVRAGFRNASGRYLHLGIGTTADDGCDAQLTVVVDRRDVLHPSVYDAAGAAVEPTRYPIPEAWDDTSRLELDAAFSAVTCLAAATYASADPAEAGSPLLADPHTPLRAVGFDTTSDPYLPASVACPEQAPAGGPIIYETRFRPNQTYPSYAVPSHVDEVSFEVRSTDDVTVVSTPEPITDVDLWTAEPSRGEIVAEADDPAEVFQVNVGDAVAHIDEGAYVARCGAVPVSNPAPTGWVGTLAGQTWWRRGEGFNSGIGSYDLHATYEFIDDEWVWFDDEHSGLHAAGSCREVSTKDTGCHRYYYDEATRLLQIDDRRAPLTDNGWQMPRTDFSGSTGTFRPDHLVLPVERGKRFRFVGSGKAGRLVLRMDGTYAFTGREPEHDKLVAWKGRYQLVPGEEDELVLRHGRKTFRAEVHLYVGPVGGVQRLIDLDTEWRLFRFRRA